MQLKVDNLYMAKIFTMAISKPYLIGKMYGLLSSWDPPMRPFSALNMQECGMDSIVATAKIHSASAGPKLIAGLAWEVGARWSAR